MNADAYQTAAARTLIDEPDHAFTGNELMLMWCGLGLGGESGEILDLLKKGICHQHGLDTAKLIDECGDLLWYLSGICTLIGVPLSEVMERNVTKLKQRYPNGYASTDSKARVDIAPEPQPGRGRKADILSALQYYGPMALRQLEVKLNVNGISLSSYLTAMWRNGEVTREFVRLDDTQRRFYRYIAVDVYRCEKHQS